MEYSPDLSLRGLRLSGLYTEMIENLDVEYCRNIVITVYFDDRPGFAGEVIT